MLAKDCVNRARRFYDTIDKIEARERKRKEACLEGLQSLNKELLVASSNVLEL